MDMHFEGTIFQTHAEELSRRLRHPFPPYRLLDLRPPRSYAAGHIQQAVPTTIEELTASLPAGVTAATEVVLVGEGPNDTALRPAALALLGHGVARVVEFPGGMLEWRQRGLPIQAGSRAA